MSRLFADVVARQLRTSTSKADSRTKLIRAVRATARAGQLDDDDRKAIQLELTGKTSMADMTLAELGRVLDHLNKGKPRSASATRPHVGKVKALWWTLYWLGEVEEPNDTALDAFVRRQTGLSSIRFLDHRHAPSVIEALKSMAVRAGVIWPTPAKLAEMTTGSDDLTLPRLERHAVLRAIWGRLVEAEVVTGLSYINYVESAFKLSINHFTWSETELDLAIRSLGKRLRRALNKQAWQAD